MSYTYYVKISKNCEIHIGEYESILEEDGSLFWYIVDHLYNDFSTIKKFETLEDAEKLFEKEKGNCITNIIPDNTGKPFCIRFDCMCIEKEDNENGNIQIENTFFIPV